MSAARDPLGPNRGPLELLSAMAHTRLELMATDVGAHLESTMTALGFSVAAFVLSLVALTFAGVAVIAVFWETHRVLACLGTTAGYIVLAGAFVGIARARWRARPDPFAATFRELELDREAVEEAS